MVIIMLTVFIVAMVIVYGLSALFPEKDEPFNDPYDRKSK
jgi:hypothetical protein